MSLLKTVFEIIFGKKNAGKETEARLKRTITANEFVNVKDIMDEIVYSKDGYIFTYIKIKPISLELLSEKEQRAKGRQFTSEFSAIKQQYKLFSISRPVDVTFMIDNLNKLHKNTSDIKRKEVIMKKIHEVNQFALSGDILEHQFFMILWTAHRMDAERELLKQTNEIIGRFRACGSEANICKKSDIVKLFNLFSNPNYAHLEDGDFEEYIPFVG